MVYLDNAATTELCIEAKNALLNSFDLYGNPSSAYKLGRITKKKLNDSIEIISKIINAQVGEIYFTSGGSESDTWAITRLKFSDERNIIITSEFEHSAVLNSVNYMSDLGFKIIKIKPNKNGIITPDSLKSIISSKVALVSIMMINNEIGSIQPIKELADITHQYGAIFHCDAVQAVGHYPIDVLELNVDLLSASAHKFHGPKGVGFLYKRKNIELNNLIFGGHQQFGLRPGTENIMLISSMASALKSTYSQINQYYVNCQCLKDYLISKLNENCINYKINGIQNYNGIISLCIYGIDNEALVNFMDLNNICISYGSACNTGKLEPSHVLKSIGMSDNEANSTIRLSFSIYNTYDDINDFVRVLKKFIDIQMKM